MPRRDPSSLTRTGRHKGGALLSRLTATRRMLSPAPFPHSFLEPPTYSRATKENKILRSCAFWLLSETENPRLRRPLARIYAREPRAAVRMLKSTAEMLNGIAHRHVRVGLFPASSLVADQCSLSKRRHRLTDRIFSYAPLYLCVLPPCEEQKMRKVSVPCCTALSRNLPRCSA